MPLPRRPRCGGRLTPAAAVLVALGAARAEAPPPAGGRPCEREVRRAVVQALHRAIDGFLARGLCRLDLGALCRTGRDARPFAEGREAFAGSDGAWAMSGHSGESSDHTSFLFDLAFERAPAQICEVGFNAGHSAVTLLTAAGPNSSYLGFDMSVLNPGSNEALFDLVRAWLGPSHRMEMHWGDAGETLPRYVQDLDLGDAAGPACELIFYDGRHDAISVLTALPLLRRLAARGRPLVVLDDARCRGVLCGHSSLAWDFLVWAGLIREILCKSVDSGHGFGACAGYFRRGRGAARCTAFDVQCVLDTYPEAYERGLGPQEWPRCCLATARDFVQRPLSIVKV